jgi:hypothetical protein
MSRRLESYGSDFPATVPVGDAASPTMAVIVSRRSGALPRSDLLTRGRHILTP